MIDLLVLAAILAACTAGGLLLLRVAGALPDARDEWTVVDRQAELAEPKLEQLGVGKVLPVRGTQAARATRSTPGGTTSTRRRAAR